MNFDLNEFVELERNTSSIFTANDIRLGVASLTMGKNVAEAFQGKDVTTRTHIKFRYSAQKQLLYLEKASRDDGGFSVVLRETGTACLTPLPASFIAARVTRGLYKPVADQPNLFALTEEDGPSPESPEVRYLIENNTLNEKDIVSWYYRPESNKSRRGSFATGRIIRLYDKNIKGTLEEWAGIKPLSKNYLDAFPTQKIANVKVSNLLLREKG